ncbi:MAG: PEP-CTERM sorting domain-containing protein [Bryobacteraceae bacterium]
MRKVWLGSMGLSLLLTGAGTAFATSCGTIANPTGCSITVGSGSTTFAFTSFQLASSASSGGGNVYQGADISIDLATGGGTTAILTFTKNSSGPTPNSVFFVNPTQASAFTVTYSLNVSAGMPGTVNLLSTTNSFVESHATNGAPQNQEIVEIMLVGTSCIVNPAVGSSTTCVLPSATLANVGNILTLAGNSGNASVLQFSNLFAASFIADTGGGAVPEPGTYGLMGAGLAVLGLLRRRR